MRGYTPRRATVDLMAEIMARPGVRLARPIAPSRSKPTRLRITLDSVDGNGRPIYSDFTLPEARAWLAAERAADGEFVPAWCAVHLVAHVCAYAGSVRKITSTT